MSSQPESHIPILFYGLAGAALFYFLYNLRRIFSVSIGQPEPRRIKPLEALRNLCYYGIGQRRVSSRRFGYPTIMHLCLGWGFIELFFATTVDFFLARGWLVDLLPHKDTPWFAILNELGGLALLTGVIMALGRRFWRDFYDVLPHNHFAGRGNRLGDTGILLVLLVLVVGGFFAESARLALELPVTAWASFVARAMAPLLPVSTWAVLQPWLWWSHALLALALVALLPQTKLFHLITATANVTLTNTAERGILRSMNVTALMEDPANIPDDITLGAGKVGDFTWKQLLDAEACTECARCTSVCPAHAVGLPLSPMKIMQDIRHNLYAETIGDHQPHALTGGLISTDELWACTTCAACMEVCPVLIDHVPAVVDMRRFLVLSEGRPPQDAAPTLEKTGQYGNPWGFPREHRLKWAENAGLELQVMARKGKADILYWVGCAGAYDPRNQAIARSMVAILQAAGVDFAVLGTEENCTGDAARRMGEEYLYETLAGQNLATLSKYSFNRIVTTCPHCYQALGADYRQLGADLNVVHHTDFISGLLASGQLQLQGNRTGTITYHDPCYLGRHQNIYESPRKVITDTLAAGGQLVEMDQCRQNSFCCGAGGGNMWYEVEHNGRMNLQRFDQTMASGADTIATACSFCMTMMEDACKVRGKDDQIVVRDIAELVAGSLIRHG